MKSPLTHHIYVFLPKRVRLPAHAHHTPDKEASEVVECLLLPPPGGRQLRMPYNGACGGRAQSNYSGGGHGDDGIIEGNSGKGGEGKALCSIALMFCKLVEGGKSRW
jgi:hypothetical protein